MSLISRFMTKENLKTTICDFEHAGDELPLHSHADGYCHITIVALGALKVFGPWGPSGEHTERAVKAGAYIEWEPGQEHGFVATEAGSRIFNIAYQAAAA